MESSAMASFIMSMPKAELHVHIEGSIRPATMLRLAEKNGVRLGATTVEELCSSFDFEDELLGFLPAYNRGLEAIREEEDFYEVTFEYLEKCDQQNVLHTEMHLDPQMHIARGIELSTVMAGVTRARQEALRKFGLTSGIILGLYCDHAGATAEETLRAAMAHKGDFVAVGFYPFDVEGYKPVDRFGDVVELAKSHGYRVTAHCNIGQRESVDAIRLCVRELDLDRIDHGADVVFDDELVEEVKDKGTCFTVCPNEGPNRPGPWYTDQLRTMLERGINVTVNSDDPGYFFQRYLGDVMAVLGSKADFSETDMTIFSRNAIESAWLGEPLKQQNLSRLQSFLDRRR